MTEQSTQLATVTPQRALMAQIRGDDFKEQVAMALPTSVPPARFVRAAVTALLEKPELADADQNSLFSALIRCAQSGLMPDGREAAINVYRSKVKTPEGEQWIQKAELLPMIGGYRKLAADYGWTIIAEVVYAADDFKFTETIDGPKLEHEKARPGTPRGERVAVFAIGRKRGETPVAKVLYQEDVARAKKSAKTTKVWDEHTDRMWEKTAGKLLFKSLPLGTLEERERLYRLVADEPADAAALMYGEAARESLGELPSVATDADRQQAGEAGPSGGADPADPAGGDDWDAVDGTADEIPAWQIAGEQTIVPGGNYQGQSLITVAATKEGQSWLKRALGNARDPEFRASLELFVEGGLPDIWAEYVARKAA